MARLVLASVLAAAEAGTLAVTYEDCGAKHARVTDLQPTSIHTGRKETLVGTGTSDEDVTSAHFTATVSALGSKLSECSGDGTKDIVCKLPMGTGKITVKALSFPLAKGTVSVPVEVKTSSMIPTSLANVDVHVAAEDQNGESLICLDVHTKGTSEEVEEAFEEIVEKVEEAFEEIVQGGTLAVTYEDCGAKHARVTDLQPTSIHVGRKETLVGTGTSDEDVASAHFTATVSALGAKLSECSGDGTKDIVCKLPMGAGKITVKALTFPLAKGTVSVPVEVKTSPMIPASLANVDVHVAAEDQNGESLICLDVHTKGTSEEVEEAFEVIEKVEEAFEDFVQGGTLAVTYEDCGAKHAQVTDLQPTSIHVGRKETLVGTGTSDEDVTSAHFTATVSALGAKLSECSGDGTKDIVCKLPMGAGKITVKALSFPLAKGTVSVPVEVKTSPMIPASLANVDVHVAAEDQNGESLICLDVHTKAMKEESVVV